MEKVERTLLVTDLEDSTALVESLGDTSMSNLGAVHDRMARDLLTTWRGQEIDKTDGFLLLFESVADALGYADGYHAVLVEISRLSDAPIRARAGVHFAKVILRENIPADVARGAKPVEVEGIAKPVAARIMATARGGQTLLSAAARTALGTEDDARLTTHGHWRLKGVAEPIELFEWHAEAAAATSPGDADKAYRVALDDGLWIPRREIPNNLPRERDPFVGRERLLGQLGSLLMAGSGSALISLLGPGGMGKSRLACRAARASLGEFPGGAWFCDFSEARSADDARTALAGVLDVPSWEGGRLARALAARGRCLVILDNFERVVDAADETIDAWMDAAVQATFLVTSREMLHMHGETSIVVEPLDIASTGVRLFERRAQERSRRFQLTDANRADVEEIVRLLDGIPLAIELAAARATVLSPAKLRARMTDRFRLLVGGRGTAARQATLRAAIDGSWNTLKPWERSAMAQCSVFRGGFTLEAAEAVIDLEAWEDAPMALDAIQDLVEKSLVRRDNAVASADRLEFDEPYFGMFMSMREYAQEKLDGAVAEGEQPGRERDRAFERHGAHFAALGSRAALNDVRRDPDPARRERFARELPNLMIAARRAVARDDGPMAARTSVAAWAVISSQGGYQTGRDLLAEALRTPSLTGRLRARALRAYAKSLKLTQSGDQSLAHVQEAEELARAEGDRALEVLCRIDVARYVSSQGTPAEALELIAAAVAMTEGEGDEELRGDVFQGRGLIQWAAGDIAAARADTEEALRIALKYGDSGACAELLPNLGAFCSRLGDADAAERHLRTSLALALEGRRHEWEADTRANLGLAAARSGDFDEARMQLENALAVFTRLGDARARVAMLGALAEVELAAGGHAAALVRSQEALDVMASTGERSFATTVYRAASNAAARGGHRRDARAIAQNWADDAHAASDRSAEAEALQFLTGACLDDGDLAAAAVAIARAEPLLPDADERAARALHLVHVAHRADLARAQGDLPTARRALADAETMVAEMGGDPASEVASRLERVRGALTDAG